MLLPFIVVLSLVTLVGLGWLMWALAVRSAFGQLVGQGKGGSVKPLFRYTIPELPSGQGVQLHWITHIKKALSANPGYGDIGTISGTDEVTVPYQHLFLTGLDDDGNSITPGLKRQLTADYAEFTDAFHLALLKERHALELGRGQVYKNGAGAFFFGPAIFVPEMDQSQLGALQFAVSAQQSSSPHPSQPDDNAPLRSEEAFIQLKGSRMPAGFYEGQKALAIGFDAARCPAVLNLANLGYGEALVRQVRDLVLVFSGDRKAVIEGLQWNPEKGDYVKIPVRQDRLNGSPWHESGPEWRWLEIPLSSLRSAPAQGSGDEAAQSALKLWFRYLPSCGQARFLLPGDETAILPDDASGIQITGIFLPDMRFASIKRWWVQFDALGNLRTDELVSPAFSIVDRQGRYANTFNALEREWETGVRASRDGELIHRVGIERRLGTKEVSPIEQLGTLDPGSAATETYAPAAITAGLEMLFPEETVILNHEEVRNYFGQISFFEDLDTNPVFVGVNPSSGLKPPIEVVAAPEPALPFGGHEGILSFDWLNRAAKVDHGGGDIEGLAAYWLKDWVLRLWPGKDYLLVHYTHKELRTPADTPVCFEYRIPAGRLGPIGPVSARYVVGQGNTLT